VLYQGGKRGSTRSKEATVVGPLTGVRVIDFGQYIAGPLAAMLLADAGADVVRVEPPGGPRWATPANATWNRGKRSIVLDLRDGADQATARRLVASADVVVENFRPGVMERLGLGPRAMTEARPRLIYLSLPGFAADDPRAALPAWEGVVGAATGTYRAAAAGGQAGQPVYTAIPIASHFAAFLGAVSVAMALVARERDGRGQRIEVPLFDAAFAAIGAHGLLIDGKPAGGRPDDFWGGRFACADGRWVHFSGSTPRFRERLLNATGNGHWRAEGLLDLGRLARDPALEATLRERLRALFRSRPAAEWEELGGAAVTPISLCRTTAEWIATPHARAARVVWPVDDPGLGTVWQPGAAVRLSEWPRERPRPAPAPDADRAAVLAELERALAPPAAELPPPLRSALEGYRVVDLTQVLAGPTAGRTLAEFGADVVKINNPREEGAGYHTSVHRYHTDVNRGKRTVLLDLKTAEGQDILRRLVRDADVVLQNARLGVAERLGTGYDQLRALRPDLVYVSVSAYGYDGPWGAWPGYESNAQAVSGMQVRYGGDGPPLMQPFAIDDYGTGLLAAFGAALALYHRLRTGRGQRVEAALAFTATLLQSPYLQDYAGKRWDEPRGQAALGTGPLQRLYRASDGWLFLGARASDLSALVQVEGLAGVERLPAPGQSGGPAAVERIRAPRPVHHLADAEHSATPAPSTDGPESDDALPSFLAERLATAPAATWVARLTAAGIAAQPVTAVSDLMADPWAVAHGLSVTREHDTGQRITTIGPAARLARTPPVPGRPAASPGADAASVLRDLGLEDQLEALLGKGVIAIEPSRGPRT
jgi:crotonobetainyl-CoA:carnitine CoA-transferase CaiB-like acyl-CoA transferase